MINLKVVRPMFAGDQFRKSFLSPRIQNIHLLFTNKYPGSKQLIELPQPYY